MNNEITISFPEMKMIDDDLEVDFCIEVLVEDETVAISDNNNSRMNKEIAKVNAALDYNNQRLNELNSEMTRLTNSADGIDYMVAVGSGILAGIIDSFWVGEFSFERGKTWSGEKINAFVKNVAGKNGYKGNDLEGAIRHLEKGFGAPSDSVSSSFGGGLQHHLRDFAHHPTPVGLVFSMITQFTSKSYGTDKNGMFKIVEVKNKLLIGKDIPQKILFGTVFWFLHMISDMAGSSLSPGAGTGLPGPILSLMKELSALPFFDNLKNEDGVKVVSLWISKLFNGTMLAERDENGKIMKESAQLMRFDLRAELGIVYELGRQAIPVIINECIVRSFYFIRRLAGEIKEKEITRFSEFKKIDWNKVKPAKNRTIVRMLTIATGTFTLVDAADAAIRGAIASGGNAAVFASKFLLRVNFVGVGRFAVAIGTDAAMGFKREKLRNERIAIISEQLHLNNVKVFYLQADVWIAAEKTERTINEAIEMMHQTSLIFLKALRENRESMDNIGKYSDDVEKHNSGLLDEIDSILKWG